MRKMIISALVLGTLGAAAPAAAQYGDRGQRYEDRNDRSDRGYRNDDRIDFQIDRIEERIRWAAQNRRISRREADRLLFQANQIDRLEDRYSRNGLTRWEVQDLRNRVQNLRAQLRFERQDGDNRRY